jgi:hypothetical protein
VYNCLDTCQWGTTQGTFADSSYILYVCNDFPKLVRAKSLDDLFEQKTWTVA